MFYGTRNTGIGYRTKQAIRPGSRRRTPARLRAHMTRLGDFPIPGYGGDYIETFSLSDTDFPTSVTLNGVDYVVNSHEELSGLLKRVRKIAKKVTRPVTRITEKVLKPIVRPFRPIVAKAAALTPVGLVAQPQQLGIKSKRSQEAFTRTQRLLRVAAAPAAAVTVSFAKNLIRPGAPAPVETQVGPTIPTETLPEVAPLVPTSPPAPPIYYSVGPPGFYSGGGGGGGGGGGMEPEAPLPEEAPPEGAPAPGGPPVGLILLGLGAAGLYFYSQKG